jgi:hypothetical protein
MTSLTVQEALAVWQAKKDKGVTPAAKSGRVPHTKRVVDALSANRDFMTLEQLMEVTGSTYNQVNASLFYLRKRGAVDVVVQWESSLCRHVGYWFGTPATDDRTRVVEEREPEAPGSRKPRKARIARVKARAKPEGE